MSNIRSIEPVSIRMASDEDAAAVRRLAERDSAAVPAGPVLVAEVAGELRAAIALDRGTVIADPFRHTWELVALLRARHEQARRRASLPRLVARSHPPLPTRGRLAPLGR